MAEIPDIFPLDDDVRSGFSCHPGIGVLRNLSKVNIFLGPNNSGKSLLMRSLFQSPDRSYSTSSSNNS